MAHTRLINLNGSAGAFVAVSATQVTRRFDIIEDGSVTAQGIQMQFADGNTPPFTTIRTVLPPAQPVTLGTPIPWGHGYGLVIGTPPDNSGGYAIAATLLCNLRSATATATTVAVTEYD
ncbi:MAG TPA: hypothetical protein VMQ60_03310 [Acidobacteriaceae bacterium]|jgi:pantoate kinase|nr:hypothetical protein [Acidobacteriaceae bacterium]